MRPTSLSATAIQTYESCPARFQAEVIDKTPDISGSAANLGTVVHSALEFYVANGHHKDPKLSVLLNAYAVYYDWLFTDRKRYDEGREMLESWWNRTDLRDGRTVLSTEQKNSFELKTSAGIIPFNYIFDRCDELPDGSIEVVDYKTVVLPLQPEDLRQRLQPRCYALAAAIQYPNRPSYWVTFDLLRWDTVGVKFTREDNIATWNYLREVSERILADSGTRERLNPECRYCVRRAVCSELIKHAAGGGPLATSSLEAAADQRAKLDYAKAALDRQIKDLDEYILAEAEERELLEFSTQQTQVKITIGSRREIDSERAAKVLGPEAMIKYGKLQISAVDEILKNGGLGPEERSALKQLIRKKPTAPSVKTKPLAVIGDDD